MIRVYLCWSNREPEFQRFLAGTHLLVSPALQTKRWNVKSWKELPDSLMVDSGAFTQSKRQGIVDVNSCLAAQLRILDGWPIEREAVLIHYDKPLDPRLPFDQYQARVAANLATAEDYIAAFPRAQNLKPMAVIHALDGETLVASYLEMRRMGYERFAIGSLVALIYRSRSHLQSLLQVCQEAGLENLHLLGIASPTILKEQLGPWIGSFDSSAPVRQAIGGTVFYSRPFRRYALRPTGLQKLGNKSYGSRAVLDMPLPCRCPVCMADGHALLSPNEFEARQSRKIHNAYHLIAEVNSWAA